MCMHTCNEGIVIVPCGLCEAVMYTNWQSTLVSCCSGAGRGEGIQGLS